MLPNILRLVGLRAAQYVNQEFRAALFPFMPYLKRLGLGFSLVVASFVAWLMVLLFCLLGLFFYLANLDALTASALWTAVFSFGIGLVLTLLGFSMMRKP